MTNNTTTLVGPIKLSDCSSVLAYSSKLTGIVVDENNLSVTTERVKNLKNPLGYQYSSAPVRKSGDSYYINITPSTNLAYAPREGFDTLVYQIRLNLGNINTEIPVGFTKLDNIVGEVSNTSVYYNEITVYFDNFPDTDDVVEEISEEAESAELEQTIPRHRTEYLKPFKKRADLNYWGYSETPIYPGKSGFFKRVELAESSNFFIWPGPGLRNESNYLLPRIVYSDRVGNTTKLYKYLSGTNGSVVEISSSISTALKTRGLKNIKFFVNNYIIDSIGNLYTLSDNFSYVNFVNYRVDWKTDRPLLDISTGKLVCEKSEFAAEQEARERILDISDIRTPLKLISADLRKIPIYVKSGKWFIFDLTEKYGLFLASNDQTSVVFSNTAEFYIVNDACILVRDGDLLLFSDPGNYCNSTTKNIIQTNYSFSRLLRDFEVGGDVVSEAGEEILTGPLNRFRRRGLPLRTIKIVGAYSGLIFYTIKLENGKTQLDYL